MNVFVGLLQEVITPLYLMFTANGDPAVILGASGLFLFGFTYLYVAANSTFDLDGSGLGSFCRYVVGPAPVYGWFNIGEAEHQPGQEPQYSSEPRGLADASRLSGYQFNSRKERVPGNNMQMCLTFTAAST